MYKYFGRWSKFLPLILCAGLIAPGISYAASITYQFVGEFDDHSCGQSFPNCNIVTTNGGVFDNNPLIGLGTEVTFTFVFDLPAPPNTGPSGGNATWLNLGSMTIDFGGISTTITPGPGASGTPSNNDTTVAQSESSVETILWYDGSISTAVSTANINTAHYQMGLADGSFANLLTLGTMPAAIDVSQLSLSPEFQSCALFCGPFFNGETSTFSVDYSGIDGIRAAGHFTSSSSGPPPPTSTPEPATLTLFGLGLLGLGVARRRKKRAA